MKQTMTGVATDVSELEFEVQKSIRLNKNGSREEILRGFKGTLSFAKTVQKDLDGRTAIACQIPDTDQVFQVVLTDNIIFYYRFRNDGNLKINWEMPHGKDANYFMYTQFFIPGKHPY